jgi:SAM-dependent methyltransferase
MSFVTFVIISGHKIKRLIRSNDIYNKQKKATFSIRNFEKLYLDSREKENRIYTNEQVALLPTIEPSHVHSNEWQIRKRSAARLISYLRKKNKPVVVLEVGCGNGWLSGMIASLENSKITGIDVNTVELNQAKKVFSGRENLCFEEGDLQMMDPGSKFDFIIFAASIQYFSFFDETIKLALSHLNQAGEIHILDSHFYRLKDLEPARRRSNLYYKSIGQEEMTEFYFHHSWDSLNGFHHKVLYDPSELKNKLLFRKDPFPWIRIKAK